MATHARRRYRLIAKNPTVPSHQPDPQVWLVHYCQADPQRVVPAHQIKPSELTHRAFSERQWIESHGRLERQEFMLHQREQWPQLQLPQAKTASPNFGRNPYPQQTMPNPGNPRFSGQYYQQQGPMGQSPAKRQRQESAAASHGPPASAMPPQSAVQDTRIEDEENVTYGDLLDQLTQRELSLTRYMQHHEWMEEVFSSPYATGQILPVDLGFGLIGELSGLTEGIFETLSAKLAKDKDVDTRKSIQPQDVQVIEARVGDHIKKIEQEMAQMKAEHAKAMDDARRSRQLSHAESKLSNASWSTGAQNGGLEEIVKEVEQMVNGKIEPVRLATLVDKGGFKEKVESAPETNIMPQMSQQNQAMQMQPPQGQYQQQQPPMQHQQAHPQPLQQPMTQQAMPPHHNVQPQVAMPQVQPMTPAPAPVTVPTPTPTPIPADMPTASMPPSTIPVDNTAPSATPVQQHATPVTAPAAPILATAVPDDTAAQSHSTDVNMDGLDVLDGLGDGIVLDDTNFDLIDGMDLELGTAAFQPDDAALASIVADAVESTPGTAIGENAISATAAPVEASTMQPSTMSAPMTALAGGASNAQAASDSTTGLPMPSMSAAQVASGSMGAAIAHEAIAERQNSAPASTPVPGAGTAPNPLPPAQ